MSNAHDNNVMLARLGVAVCRLKLMQADIEEVGALLSAGRISAQGALYWLRENGLLHLCLTTGEMEDAA